MQNFAKTPVFRSENARLPPGGLDGIRGVPRAAALDLPHSAQQNHPPGEPPLPLTGLREDRRHSPLAWAGHGTAQTDGPNAAAIHGQNDYHSAQGRLVPIHCPLTPSLYTPHLWDGDWAVGKGIGEWTRQHTLFLQPFSGKFTCR